jgi:chemotaxis protein CheD
MSGPNETMVRMGDHAASARAGDTLVSIGLGSCIGLALVDRRRAIAALAHIVLPASLGQPAAAVSPARFADTAVPLLLEEVARLGAVRASLEAALVGGAQMFSFAGGKAGSLDVGQRNEQATRTALRAAGIRVSAADTSGNKGRTIRVYVGTGVVTVREAGGTETELLAPAGGRLAGSRA